MYLNLTRRDGIIGLTYLTVTEMVTMVIKKLVLEFRVGFNSHFWLRVWQMSFIQVNIDAVCAIVSRKGVNVQ